MQTFHLVLDREHSTQLKFSYLLNDLFSDLMLNIANFRTVIVLPKIANVAIKKENTDISISNFEWIMQNKNNIRVKERQYARGVDYVVDALVNLNSGDAALILNSSVSLDLIVQQYNEKYKGSKGVVVDAFSLTKPSSSVYFEQYKAGTLTVNRIMKRPYEIIENTFRTKINNNGDSYVYPLEIKRSITDNVYSGWVKL